MLTPTETAVLDFEARRWKYAGAKAAAVRELFGWSQTRYFQVLTALLARPEALAYAPGTVRRLQRIEGSRRKARCAS